VCERWARGHDAASCVVRARPAHGVALRLRGGYEAVLALPGWAAHGAAVAEADEGVELRILRAAVTPSLLLHARVALSGAVAVLFDAREDQGAATAEPDAAARWLTAAQALLDAAGELPSHADGLTRLVAVLEALWDASSQTLLGELFARPAAAEAMQQVDSDFISGDVLEEVLTYTLRHARDALSLIDVYACRQTCHAWCRVASDPVCYARVALPPVANGLMLRAVVALAAGECIAWRKQAAALAAAGMPQQRPFGVQKLDVAACERIGYAALLCATRAASATLTSLRLREVAYSTVTAAPPYVIVLPAQLQALKAAAPGLNDVRVASFTAPSMHAAEALLRDAPALSLRLGTLTIEASAALHREPGSFDNMCWVAERFCRSYGDRLLNGAATRDATRIVLRMPAKLRGGQQHAHRSIAGVERLREAMALFSGDPRVQVEWQG
jgi:hypothetical protein